MIKRRKLYEDSLIFTPRENFPFFYAYRNTYPDVDFKLLSIEDVEKMFSYSHDDRALIFLLKKGMNYDKANKTLKALSRMKKDKTYKDPYLNQIYPYFLELLDKGYLYNNEYPFEFFKNRNMVISRYGDASYLSSLIKDLPNIALSYDLLDEKVNPKIYKFDDFHDELHYIFLDIISLLKRGVSPSEITLTGVYNDFLPELDIYSKIYDLPIIIPSSLSLINVPFVKKAFLSLSKEENINLETLDKIRLQYEDFESNPNYDQFVDYMYSLFDEELDRSNYLEALKARLEEKKKKGERYSNCINLTSSFFSPRDGYSYHLCFSSKQAYKIPQEDGLINDEAKKELGMLTSLEEEKQNRQNLVFELQSNKNMMLCLPSFYLETAFYPSPLEEELDMEEISNPSLPSFEYSSYYAKFSYSYLKEKQEKFSISSPYLDSLEKISGPLPSFDHSFKKFELEPYNKDYSYTSLNTYSSCPFKFYCSYILGINEFDDTSSSLYGNLAHNVLSKMYDNGFSFDIEFNKELANQIKKDTPYSTRLYLKLSYPYIKNTYECIRRYDDSLVSPSYKTEFNSRYGFGPSFIKGRIDKAIFLKKANAYMIMDYKTGSASFNLDKVKYGLSLQLPIYYLLLKNDHRFSSYSPLGLFIAEIKVEFQENEKKDICLFDLNGIFTNKDYKWAGNLEYIKGVKENKDETLSKTSESRFIVDDALSKLEEETKVAIEKIMQGVNEIDFKVAPVKYKNEDLPCKYCPYKDICFRDPNDIVEINPDNIEIDEEDE